MLGLPLFFFTRRSAASTLLRSMTSSNSFSSSFPERSSSCAADRGSTLRLPLGPEGLIGFGISAELTKELRAACANIPDSGWTPIEERVHETVFAAEVEFAPGDWPKNPRRYSR